MCESSIPKLQDLSVVVRKPPTVVISVLMCSPAVDNCCSTTSRITGSCRGSVRISSLPIQGKPQRLMMVKSKHQGREKTCFVPLRRSGYRSNPSKASMFCVSSDPTRLAEWERLIKRQDRNLTPACVFCEKHFGDCYI
ncbi:hypothetical protein V5799_022823 [Amblyomma americanum]|uniref:THAP-type domain-containing protein n=1 Tax=Amblyomma americanum TaxID=6943 RepID=A0AAQ4FL14_AMBAM